MYNILIKYLKSIIIILILSFTSCIRTEVINAPNIEIDTARHTKTYINQKDTISIEDTIIIEDSIRVPIGFNPIVEDWEIEDINMQQ